MAEWRGLAPTRICPTSRIAIGVPLRVGAGLVTRRNLRARNNQLILFLFLLTPVWFLGDVPANLCLVNGASTGDVAVNISRSKACSIVFHDANHDENFIVLLVAALDRGHRRPWSDRKCGHLRLGWTAGIVARRWGVACGAA